MAFTPYYPGGWQSGEEGGTPITPAALNHMDDGIAGAYDICTRITGISITTASSGNAQITSSVPSGYVPVFAYLEGIVAPAATEMAVVFRYSQQWYVNIKTVAGTAVSGQDRSIGLICVKA